MYGYIYVWNLNYPKWIKNYSENKFDGTLPFAEGKEIIGGYFIINAEDYDEAVALCEGYPDYDSGGSVIVRQVMKMEMPAEVV